MILSLIKLDLSLSYNTK